MSNIITTAGVVGIDGVKPVYEPDGRWTIWALHQMFTGPDSIGTGKYVPKINDWVVDIETSIVYTCVGLDLSTLTPRLERSRSLAQDQNFDAADLILGVGPGTIADTFRVYLNKNVMPHTLTVDGRLHTYSPDAERFTIFRGTDIEGDARAVSQIYNQSNELVGTSIPLVLAESTGDNKSVKAFPMCYTTDDIPDGEVLVLITYSDAGHQIAKVRLLVENTQFTPVADASTKYITNIGLESPFISTADPNQLRFPLNVPTNGLSLFGVVSYNDGSKKRLPVNNGQFNLRGLDNFVSTYAGQSFDLVLDYRPSEDEVVLGLQTTASGSIVRAYTAVTTNYEGMYSPKLYGYPVWQDAVRGYRLEWWLYDMERRMAQLVTPFVKINDNSAPFQPTGYGFKQSLGVSINLKDVNPSGLALIHVQTIDIVLRQPGDARTTNWAVGFIPQQDILFGEGNNAKMKIINQNLMTLNIACGETDQAKWLQRLYRLTYPLTDQGRETQAPDPTHFAICTPNWEVAYPLDKWNVDLSLNYTLTNSATVFVKFFIRTPDTDIQLAISAMPVYQQ